MNLQDYSNSVGVGKVTVLCETEPTEYAALKVFKQPRAQRIIILGIVPDPIKKAHIPGISDPFLAIASLKHFHVFNSGITP